LRILRVLIAVIAVVAGTAIAVNAGLRDQSAGAVPPTAPPANSHLPATPDSYLGVYAPSVTSSAAVMAFMRPRVVMYYSGWGQPFDASFAAAASRHDAIPLVQLDPTRVRLAAIAAGRYDVYLTKFANAVKKYRQAVIMGFAHEMNGSWYSWGYHKASPADFVAAWQHIWRLFRSLGAGNVTWLWTVNVINNAQHGAIPDPKPWWPGDRYVQWVGIDGYYLQKTYQFTSLFGPTISAVREFTRDPILISETGAPQPYQVDAISNLVEGVRNYGLLGFVWFDGEGAMDWRITAALSKDALSDTARAYDQNAK
jgi:hypothetical protein